MQMLLKVLFLALLSSISCEFVFQCVGEYLEEIGSIPTVGATNDLASFEFDLEFYLVTPHHHDGEGYVVDSTIWKLDRQDHEYRHHQDIQTVGCHDVERWYYDFAAFLFFGNMKNGSLYTHKSPIYRLRTPQTYFQKIQDIETTGVSDSEHFFIGSDLYLVVSTLFNGTHTGLNSPVYKWDDNLNNGSFALFQNIPTNAAFACHAFQIGTNHYLAFANAYGYEIAIYMWDGNQFLPHSTVPSPDQPRAITVFQMDNEEYLFIGTEGVDNPAKIYRWSTDQFVFFQDLENTEYKNREGTYFETTSYKYFAVSNLGNDTTYRVKSPIFRWSSVSNTFELYQEIEGDGAEEWKVLWGPWDNKRIILSEYGEIGSGSRTLNSTMYEIRTCKGCLNIPCWALLLFLIAFIITM